MYIVFDIGGTKTRVAFSDDGQSFGEPRIFDTPQNFDEEVAIIARVAHELAGNTKISASAGGIRGYLNEDKSMLVRDNVLTDWVNKPLKENLEKELGCSVFLENDSALAGLGEATHGAGKGHDIVAYLTISTGVGGVRIDHGKIDMNAYGFEPGKIIIDPDNTLCPECDGNTLEDYISGASVEKRTGKKPYETTDKKFWDNIAHFTAFGVHNIILTWSPSIVVLGGSMMKEIGISVEDVKKHIALIGENLPATPEIKKAELGDIGGLYGALAYIKQQDL